MCACVYVYICICHKTHTALYVDLSLKKDVFKFHTGSLQQHLKNFQLLSFVEI